MSNIILGPLTSVFSAPSSCVSDDIYTLEDEGLAEEPFRRECFPEGYIPNTPYYYSPAFDCPSGYTVACSSSVVAGDSTESVHTCCPKQRAYTCQTVHLYQWQKSRGCEAILPATWTFSSLTQITSGTTNTISTTGNAGAVNAFSVQIRFPGNTRATATSSQSTISSQASATDSPDNGVDGSSGGGISPGTAAGIGVGAGLGVICLVGAIIFMVIRRRRYEKQRMQAPAGYLSGAHQQPVYPPTNSASPQTSQFLSHELPGVAAEPKPGETPLASS